MAIYPGLPGQLQYTRARIADEVLGGVLPDQIDEAIRDAIREYEGQRFWWNEERFDNAPLTDASGQIMTDVSGQPLLGSSILSTIPHQEFYPLVNSGQSGAVAALSRISHFDKLVILAFNNRYPLVWETPQWVDDQSIGPSWVALPQFWTLQARQLRLYPIPDQQYPIYVIGTVRFPTLINDEDSNPWLLEAELLIRRRAEQLLYQLVVRNPDMAATIGSEDDHNSPLGKAYVALKRETMTRGGPPRIRPTQW